MKGDIPKMKSVSFSFANPNLYIDCGRLSGTSCHPSNSLYISVESNKPLDGPDVPPVTIKTWTYCKTTSCLQAIDYTLHNYPVCIFRQIWRTAMICPGYIHWWQVCNPAGNSIHRNCLVTEIWNPSSSYDNSICIYFYWTSVTEI